MQAIFDVILRILADGLVVPIVILGGIAMLKLPRAQWSELFPRAIVTGLVALTFAKIISLLYQGERPFEILGIDPGASYLANPGFPSDHSLFVFTIAFVVWASTRNKRITMGLLIMSVLVALGRVLALVHTPADVLGGFACALAAVWVMYGKRILP